MVAEEIAQGRRVFLDFTQNPRVWTEESCFALCPEAYWYLHNSDCLFGTPIRRLKRLNPKAVELYASHGIDLSKEKLEIAVCAQHINGGVAVDANWESSVRGLYAAGEAAGTFGVYRPGGSALNSTQVGALRAAEHIASLGHADPQPITYDPPCPTRSGFISPSSVSQEIQRAMSLHAAFHRDVSEMKRIMLKVDHYLSSLNDIDSNHLLTWYRLRDQLLTTKAVLSAMICSAVEVGSHGSALILGDESVGFTEIRRTRTITSLNGSLIQPVTPIPNGELWFETVLAKQHHS